MTNTKAEQKAQKKTQLIKTFLYRLHKRQNCCPVCPQCRNAMIDESMEFARHYAAISNSA